MVHTCCVQCSAGKIPPAAGSVSGSWPAGLAGFESVGLLGAGGVFGLVGLGGLLGPGGLSGPGGLFAGDVFPAMTLFQVPIIKCWSRKGASRSRCCEEEDVDRKRSNVEAQMSVGTTRRTS